MMTASRLCGEAVAASIREFNVLVEGDGALVVLHDIVAVQAVAVLVEIVLTLGTGELLGGQDRFADLAGLGRARLVDRSCEYVDRVKGPGALVVRRNLDGVAIGLAECLRGVARLLRIIGNTIGVVERGT